LVASAGFICPVGEIPARLTFEEAAVPKLPTAAAVPPAAVPAVVGVMLVVVGWIGVKPPSGGTLILPAVPAAVTGGVGDPPVLTGGAEAAVLIGAGPVACIAFERTPICYLSLEGGCVALNT